MKSLARMELKAGMVLGEDVLYQGRIIYPAGTKLNEEMIIRLKNYSVMCVMIMEDIDYAKTKYERLRFTDEFKHFHYVHSDCLMRYKQVMQWSAAGHYVPNHELLMLYDELSATYDSGSKLLNFLYNLLPNEDELTFNHCLNSALLAGVFADWMGMSKQNKELLILCAFYYDIGKLQLPYQILWKSGKLTDYEYAEVKKHALLGYNMVKYVALDEEIKNAIAMHHERMDGSGYPYGLRGKTISLYARYLAIIDTYIAMASPRSYRNAVPPLNILEIFEKDLQKYDNEILIPLIKRIADAQIGSSIQLNDESVWEVFIINPQHASRPIVKNENNEILNLYDHPELKIIRNL